MMGIYIKGIEMPKEPDEMIELAIFGDGKTTKTGESWRSPVDGKCYYGPSEDMNTYSALTVPPHGQLIDERKTGEWCADYDGYSDGEPVYDMWWCSACGEYFDEWDNRPTWKYCPNCGAKMIGGDEDEEPPKEGE